MQIDPAADRAMLATLPPRGRRPWLHLLSAVLELAGPGAELLSHAEQPWASATFSGTRHTITLTFAGETALAAGEAFVDALPDHEFAIPRHLVAEATVTRIDHMLQPQARMTLEANLLLLEDV